MTAPSLPDVPWVETQRARRVVVVVDVVESVRLMEVCEQDFVDRWRRFVHEVRSEILPGPGGRMVKSLGDGMLLEFEPVPQAIAAALEMQRRVGPYNAGRPVEHHLQLRVGAHVAEVVIDGIDIYGVGVNLASRLAGLANPGEIVVSSEVRDELAHGMHAAVVDLGECWMKHIDRPVRAFRIEAPRGTTPTVTTERRPGEPMGRAGIAVVPFLPRGGDPAHAAVGDALADELIAAFSQWRDWRVLSRLSTAHFRANDREVGELRRHLNAAYIVWGGLSVRGTRVRAFPELVDTSDGSVLWTSSLEFDVEDLFAGQAAVVDEVVQAVSRALIDHELRRARSLPMPSLSTYSLYLGALAMLHRLTAKDFQGARGLLEHLAERVPRSAAPHALLAKWHILHAMQGQARAGERAEVARSEARRATQIDPDNAFGLAVEGLVAMHVDNDFDRAGQCLREALRCNPQESYAWCFLSGLHSYEGDAAASEVAALRALELSPLDPTRYHLGAYAANAKLAACKYGEAIAFATESIALNRQHLPSYRILAIAQVLAGRGDAARESVQRLLQFDPQFNLRSYLQRFPGRDRPVAATYVGALREAGVPE